MLESLEPYKVRPASDALPVRFETGTLSHEGLAGVLGTVEHWEWIGREMTDCPPEADRRDRIVAAFGAVSAFERTLCKRLISGLLSIPKITVHGLTAEGDLNDRVPTIAVTAEDRHPAELARGLADHNIFTWDGQYYAVEVIERLGLKEAGGMLRIGLGQYNTAAEVDLLLDRLESLL